MPYCNFFFTIAIALLAVVGHSSCRLRATETTAVSSGDALASFGDCQVTQGYYGEMRICVDAEGADDSRTALVKNWVQESLEKWAEPLRTVDGGVNMNPVFTCDEPHLTVFVLPGKGKGFAGCGVIQAFEKFYADDSNSDERLQSEILYLVGIAAAAQLSGFEDYGSCLPDQPTSVMCLAGRSTQRDNRDRADLYPIDAENVRTAFKAWVDAGKPAPSRDL